MGILGGSFGSRWVGLVAASLTSVVLAAGCSSSDTTTQAAPAPDPHTGALGQDIIGQQRSAAAYTEAVRVKINNVYNDFCSGVLVAPQVVLTASHCVAFNPGGTWVVTAPFAVGGSQSITSSSAEAMDPGFYSLDRNTYESFVSMYHDVGLIYLPTAFTGVTYPSLSSTRYPIGATSPQVSAVGRMFVDETAPLVLSGIVNLSATTASDGFPYDNKTKRVTDGGDSGGPLFLEATHTLVGTETVFDSNKNLDYWTRLDTDVYTFISNRIASHGGTVTSLLGFKDQVSSALCARVASCCAKASAVAYNINSAECRSVYDELGFESTARSLVAAASTNVTVDNASTASCLAAISNVNDCTVSSSEMKAAVNACVASLTGLVASGGACTSSIECKGAAACVKGAFGMGTCKPLIASGSSCQVTYTIGTTVDQRDNIAQELCSKRGGGQNGLFCDAYDFGANAYRPENTWKCATARGTGAGCDTDEYCSSLVCAPLGTAAQFTCVDPAVDTPFVTSGLCAAFSQ